MRTLLLPLAVASLLASVAPSRGEFDATGGIAPAKPKVSGATFDSGVAANPAQEKHNPFRNLPIGPVRWDFGGHVYIVNMGPVKNPSNIPHPRRPANPPIAIDWGR